MSVRRISSGFPDFEKAPKRIMKVLPHLIGNEAKNHYLEGFRRGGGQTDASRGGWKARKDQGRRSRGRALLVKTGLLFGDLDVRRTTSSRVILSTQSATYASYHNRGTRTIPQREFLGPSKRLKVKIRKLIRTEIKKALTAR